MPGAIIGGGIGAATGAAVGYGSVTAIMQLGPLYAAALERHPDDSSAAWSETLKEAGAQGVLGGVGWRLFAYTPFGNAVKDSLDAAIRAGTPVTTAAGAKLASAAATKDLALQLGLAQPAVAVGQQVADNLIEGKHPAEGVGDMLRVRRRGIDPACRSPNGAGGPSLPWPRRWTGHAPACHWGSAAGCRPHGYPRHR